MKKFILLETKEFFLIDLTQERALMGGMRGMLIWCTFRT